MNVEFQPPLFAEPAQPPAQKLARTVHEAVIALRKKRITVQRQGRQHLVNGRLCESREVTRLARQMGLLKRKGPTEREIATIFHDVMATYQGSDGKRTTGLYNRLAEYGVRGHVAVNLFRACKSSERAKVYRGGGYRGAAYDRKRWAMENLAKALNENASLLQMSFGWAIDPDQEFHKFILYVDLPTGQVSFHTGERGVGPAYQGEWDQARGQAPTRICRWIADILARPA